MLKFTPKYNILVLLLCLCGLSWPQVFCILYMYKLLSPYSILFTLLSEMINVGLLTLFACM
jgi:hypothetical protein